MTLAPPLGEAVATAFGLGRARGPARFAARGELGRMYRLDTSSGPWAIKVTFDPPSEEEAERVAGFQEAAAAAGVPLPRPRRTAGGDVLATVPDESGTSDVRVRAYEWVDLDPQARVGPSEAGRILGSTHALRLPAGPVNPWYWQATGEQRLAAVVEQLEAAGAEAAPRLAALVPELVAAEALLAEVPDGTAELCHRDVNHDNLLVTAGGGATLVDWDNAGSADPRQELAQALWELCDDAGAARAFHTAYAAASGDPRPPVLEDFAMAFAVQGHLLELYGRRFLEAPPGEDRERAAWRLEEIADRPLTRDGAASLLSALP